jgi:hypothetical protein
MFCTNEISRPRVIIALCGAGTPSLTGTDTIQVINPVTGKPCCGCETRNPNRVFNQPTPINPGDLNCTKNK